MGGTPDATPELHIFDWTDGTEQFYGQIRDLAVWSDCLSDAQVRSLLGGVLPTGVGSAPSAFWRLKGSPTGEGGTPALTPVGLGTSLVVTKTARLSPPA